MKLDIVACRRDPVDLVRWKRQRAVCGLRARAPVACGDERPGECQEQRQASRRQTLNGRECHLGEPERERIQAERNRDRRRQHQDPAGRVRDPLQRLEREQEGDHGRRPRARPREAIPHRR